MTNIWKDGMMGLVIGDALGNPVQFTPRFTVREHPVKGMRAGGAFKTPAGTWTDDSSMAIATLCSIKNKAGMAYADIMDQFVAWLYEGKYTPFGRAFDEGITCTSAIENYRKSYNWHTCGITGEYANGNGALMRILPVCIYVLNLENVATALWHVHKATSLTHNHPRVKVASGIYYFMVKEIVNGTGDLRKRLQRAVNKAFIRYCSFPEEDPEFGNIAKELDKFSRLFNLTAFSQVPEDEIGSGGYVVDTLEAAVWCLIKTDNFKDALLKAVNLGSDADTVGAVTGGLAGLYYGYDAIPADWLAVIQKRQQIENLCDEMPR